MNDNNSNKIMIYTNISSLLLAGIVTLILFFTNYKIYIFSIFFGTFSGLMTFLISFKGAKCMSLQAKLNKETEKTRNYALYYMIFKMFFLLLITGVVAYLQYVTNDPKFNLIAYFIGYFLTRIIIVVVSYIIERRLNIIV